MDPPISAGVIRSNYDPTDNIFEHLSFGHNHKAPEELHIDLRQYSLPSRNQGNRGTCAAFAGATIRETQELLGNIDNDNKVGYLSPEFIYYHRDNSPGQGMSGRNVFKILKNVGTVPESDYPYGSIHEPSSLLYEKAHKHKITFFARINTMNGLKRALTQIGPCYLVLPLYKNRPIFWKPTFGEYEVEGHAVVVIGYNSSGFIIKNSWGENWNGNGCIIFPYSDWELHWECWVCTDRNIRRFGSESGSQSRSLPRSEATLENVRQTMKYTQDEIFHAIEKGSDGSVFENMRESEYNYKRKGFNINKKSCVLF